jgi:hypothetical protein
MCLISSDNLDDTARTIRELRHHIIRRDLDLASGKNDDIRGTLPIQFDIGDVIIESDTNGRRGYTKDTDDRGVTSIFGSVEFCERISAIGLGGLEDADLVGSECARHLKGDRFCAIEGGGAEGRGRDTIIKAIAGRKRPKAFAINTDDDLNRACWTKRPIEAVIQLNGEGRAISRDIDRGSTGGKGLVIDEDIAYKRRRTDTHPILARGNARTSGFVAASTRTISAIVCFLGVARRTSRGSLAAKRGCSCGDTSQSITTTIRTTLHITRAETLFTALPRRTERRRAVVDLTIAIIVFAIADLSTRQDLSIASPPSKAICTTSLCTLCTDTDAFRSRRACITIALFIGHTRAFGKRLWSPLRHHLYGIFGGSLFREAPFWDAFLGRRIPR